MDDNTPMSKKIETRFDLTLAFTQGFVVGIAAAATAAILSLILSQYLFNGAMTNE